MSTQQDQGGKWERCNYADLATGQEFRILPTGGFERFIPTPDARDAEIAELKRRLQHVSCTWCGLVRKATTEESLAHSKVCPDHPMRALEAEIAFLKSQLAEAMKYQRQAEGEAMQSSVDNKGLMDDVRAPKSQLAEEKAKPPEVMYLQAAPACGKPSVTLWYKGGSLTTNNYDTIVAAADGRRLYTQDWVTDYTIAQQGGEAAIARVTERATRIYCACMDANAGVPWAVAYDKAFAGEPAHAEAVAKIRGGGA